MESRPGNEKGDPKAAAVCRRLRCGKTFYLPFPRFGAAARAYSITQRAQTVRILPPEMAEVETMLQLGGQALLGAAEFVLLRNMLRRVIKPPNPFKDFRRD